jgi:hypothetical protein
MLPGLEYLTFAFTLWLGLYLLGRNPANAPMRFAGLGAAAYALALAVETLAPLASPSPMLTFGRWVLVSLPVWLWLGVLLLTGFARTYPRARPRYPFGLMATATLFFALGIGLLLFPLNWLPRVWVMLGIGGDFILLGAAIAKLDAFDEGETLLPDMARSFGSAALATLLFGGPVALVMALSTGVTLPMLLLWLGLTALAMALQVFAGALQNWLDRLTFARAPRLAAERAELRAVAEALPRADDSLDLAALDETEFARLTRRALSHLGDLSRLASSPLIRLPVIATRLAARGAPLSSLERAQELKTLLTESILRLKPREKGDFGASDEWRHYNALYFPYVAGLKPYSTRVSLNGLNPAERKALDWFRANVPERTLHNWQNAAARLVAHDLAGQLRQNEPTGSNWQGHA